MAYFRVVMLLSVVGRLPVIRIARKRAFSVYNPLKRCTAWVRGG
jgi:hypothetical protein